MSALKTKSAKSLLWGSSKHQWDDRNQNTSLDLLRDQTSDFHIPSPFDLSGGFFCFVSNPVKTQ